MLASPRPTRASAVWLLGPIAAAAVSWLVVGRTFAQSTATSGEEYFEKNVRPILVARCCECHGSAKEESGLRLDSGERALAGGDGGPVIVPGEPEKSRLIAAIGYADPGLQMPPAGKLPEREIETLTEWVRRGAPWPAAAGRATGERADWKAHWAFRPIGDPAPPEIADDSWSESALDRFVLAKLHENGLSPSPEADRRTLIRRASFDLIGLPPTPAEVDAFVNDPSPTAWADLIERLLASPRYGERWGRHWLDLARYADDKGYHFFGGGDFYAYTYRDWVVRALNEDLPFDEFIKYQLAADLVVSPDDTRPLAAMGFLTVGRRFLEDVHDIIDDRIDVVSRGLLGLTVTCARCHDHKFDPIPSADYYSLYGVFAGSVEKTRTLARAADLSPEQQAYERDLAAVEGAVDAYIDEKLAAHTTEYRTRVGDYLLAGHEAQASPPMDRFMYVEEPGQMSQMVIGRWRALLDQTQRSHHPALAAWHRFAAIPPDAFAAQAPQTAVEISANAIAERRHNPHVAALFARTPTSLADVAARYGELLAGVEREWQQLVAARGAAGEPEPRELPDREREELRWLLYGPLAPPDVPRSDTEMLIGRKGQAEVAELRKKVAEFKAQRPPQLPRASVLVESPPLFRFSPRIFVRGKPTNIGPETPRQFLLVASGESRTPFPNGSGRLDLAEAIVDPKNPLTARVFVNRAWWHHFGTGLVATPSDFGMRADPPSHPELLDWLASRFIADGWSIKQLHRRILLSRTYRQASGDRPDCREIDADNRWLWRYNRRRLDLECLRDSLLAASGALDETVGGPAVDLVKAPFSRRRTIYGFVDRQNLPGMFRAFDFANPDSHSPRRYQTTVPQQALFLMNAPFVVEQAQLVASRADVTAEASLDSRIGALYRLLFGRNATADEISLGRAFAGDAANSAAGAPSVWQYGYGAFDAQAQRIASFTPLPHWSGTAWQGGPSLPDPTLGWLMLSADGGHPEAAADRLLIRRWVAPQAGEATIEGKLEHQPADGDGVQGRIVSSRHGVLGAWSVHHGVAETRVERVEFQPGDTLDFVVDSHGTIQSDQHLWAPVIRLRTPAAGSAAGEEPAEWSASVQFAGPELSDWESYVQALLLSNEFAYVD